jgi:hypothetical protein
MGETVAAGGGAVVAGVDALFFVTGKVLTHVIVSMCSFAGGR